MSKRKTTEQYIEEVNAKGLRIKVLGEYIGRDKKILHECLVCGNTWNVRPCNVLVGSGCPECLIKNGKYHVRKTHDEYVSELFSINPNIKCLEDYQGTNTGILHKCLRCGNVWTAQPANLLSGTDCPICMKSKNGLKRRHNTEDYISKLSSVNPNIYPIEPYVLSHTKILHRCKQCGNEFLLAPDHSLQGVGCSICNNKKRIKARIKTQEEFINECIKSAPTIKVVGKYKGSRKPISVECLICGHQWQPLADALLHGHACPICADKQTGLRCKKTQEEYVKELRDKFSHISLKGIYDGADVPILHHCMDCGNDFYSRPANVLSYGCGKCARPYQGEEHIKNFLVLNNIGFIQPYRFSGLRGRRNPLSYDFYLPTYNCLIEFQGEQHERPIEYFGGQKHFEIQQEHDRRKREYAKEHGYKLIEIWYYDFDRIEKILAKELNIESVETVIEA